MQKRSGARGRRRPAAAASGRAQKGFVFISHDSRDADLAKEFGELLAGATGGALEFFRSSDTSGKTGIEYGAHWYRVLMDRLGKATDMIALLTPQSIERPWILFEAGVAAGSAKAKVFCIALGVPLHQAISGPFAQFQNCRDDEEALTDLVIQLIIRNRDTQPRREAVRQLVQVFRRKVAEAQATGPGAKPFEDAQDFSAQLYEEVKLLVREMRAGRSVQVVGPRFFEEFPLRSGGMAGSLGWLMFLGAFRDELPWLYEIGLDLYRSLVEGERAAILAARERVLYAVEAGLRNDWLRSLLVKDNRERAAGLYHLADLVEIYLDQLAPPEDGGINGGEPAKRPAASSRRRSAPPRTASPPAPPRPPRPPRRRS